jgi:hypothetical protein
MHEFLVSQILVTSPSEIKITTKTVTVGSNLNSKGV